MLGVEIFHFFDVCIRHPIVAGSVFCLVLFIYFRSSAFFFLFLRQNPFKSASSVEILGDGGTDRAEKGN